MWVTVLNFSRKIKALSRSLTRNRELFPAFVVTLVGVVSFGLGRLSVQSSVPVSPRHSFAITGTASSRPAASSKSSDVPLPMHPIEASVAASVLTGAIENAPNAPMAEKKYVGSKNSDKYHLPWCSGAARIAEENKVWFSSKEEAAAAGYKPAGNCKGI